MKATFLIITGLTMVMLVVIVGRLRQESTPSQPDAPAPEQQRAIEQTLGQLPLYFIENQGQLDEQVAYYVQGADTTIYFTATGVTIAQTAPAESPTAPMSFRGVFDEESLTTASCMGFLGRPRNDSCPSNQAQRWSVKLEFVGANPNVQPIGEDQTEAIISYFKGQPEEWHTGLPTFGRVVYHDLWPGIDLVYEGIASQIKYTFIVQPGADPSQIQLAYQGATAVTLNDAGQMEVSTPLGGFTDDTPVAYQEINGERVPVEMAYVLDTAVASSPRTHTGKQPAATKTTPVSLRIGSYDPTQPLILDPVVLLYAGFIGGSSSDYGYSVALDESGNSYITGKTASTEATFPDLVGPDLTYNGGNSDAFVAKISSNGGSLIYAGYLGGTSTDIGHGIAVDGSGNAYIAGQTAGGGFPVLVGPDLTYNGNSSDAFVAKISSDGSSLIFSGYIGGSHLDYGRGIVLDVSGNVYVTGETWSGDFPRVIGPDLTVNGRFDAFVTKVNNSGVSVIYSGYIGGTGDDYGYSIAVDGMGNAYVTGSTSNDTFPVLVGPDLSHNGNTDAFVTKVSSSGSSLIYSGFIGGSTTDYGRGITVDGEGNAYITGYTSSTQATFPVTVGPDFTYNGGSFDAFITKVSSSGISLLYSGYIGGSNSDYGRGVALDAMGNAIVVGHTASNEATFPVISGPDVTYNGSEDAFVTKVSSTGASLVYGGYVGGSLNDYGYGITVDEVGNVYITGSTSSTEATFPVLRGPDLTFNGSEDAFVAKVVADDFPPTSDASSPTYAIEAPINISWNANDDISGVNSTALWVKFGSSGVWVNTGLTLPGNSGIFSYIPSSGEGTYYFATVASDNVGNTEADPTDNGDDSTLYDVTDPSSVASAPSYIPDGSITVNWNASDVSSGVSETTLWVKFRSGGLWTNTGYSQPGVLGFFIFLPASGDGTYYFATIATDNAGNEEAMPSGNGDVSTVYGSPPTIFLPVILNNYTSHFEGPMEQEDNDVEGQANGPIRLEREYQGQPNDIRDYFYFNLDTAEAVTVNLSNHVGEGLQLVVFYNGNIVGSDNTPPYQVLLPNAQPGRYDILIYAIGGYAQSPLYQLTVNAGSTALSTP